MCRNDVKATLLLHKFTRPCMINPICGLKQLWLQVNGYAWLHLHGHRSAFRNGEGVNNSKWKCMSPVGFEPIPCNSMTGNSAFKTARPRRLDDDLCLNVLQNNGMQMNTLRDNNTSLWDACVHTTAKKRMVYVIPCTYSYYELILIYNFEQKYYTTCSGCAKLFVYSIFYSKFETLVSVIINVILDV